MARITGELDPRRVPDEQYKSTNGCSDSSVTHYNQFELSFTVLRPGRCPGLCPPPHATAGVD